MGKEKDTFKSEHMKLICNGLFGFFRQRNSELRKLSNDTYNVTFEDAIDFSISSNALQNVFDATFYGLGKTHYMLFESIVTNSIYYGIAFILYITGVWQPTLIGFALLFGIGNAFDTVVSLAAYIFLLKKNKISIWDVEFTNTHYSV